MPRPFVPTSAAARVAALLVLPALLACGDETGSVAPEATVTAVPQANMKSLHHAENEIAKLVDQATAAWTAKDAAAYAALYAGDMQFVNPVGGRITGRAAFQAQHVFLFNGPFAGSTQTIHVHDVVFLSGTRAIVLQDGALTNYAFLPPGLPSSSGVVRTRVVWVVEKRGGRWEIVYQQMTPYTS
jgi:uncharacterized protein (TIGR02246 family)